jgi:nucleotide-binding universal stress UspA family protein
MKILLAIDGSPCSEAAVKELAIMQWPADTHVKVLSAAAVPRSNAPDPLHVVSPMRLKLLEREQVRLRDLVTRAADWLRNNAVEKNLQIETAVIEGEPKVVIVEEAEQWGADLIIIGCHGYGSIKRFLLGSVSLAVAVHAPCSVGIVRRPHQEQSGVLSDNR